MTPNKTSWLMMLPWGVRHRAASLLVLLGAVLLAPRAHAETDSFGNGDGHHGPLTVGAANTVVTEGTYTVTAVSTDGSGTHSATADTTFLVGAEDAVDADNDGLTDSEEARNPDTDGDTLKDEDKNHDGRRDETETDASQLDTDQGGIDDGTEVNRGSDPLDPNDDFPLESCGCGSGGSSGSLVLFSLLLGMSWRGRRPRHAGGLLEAPSSR